MGGQVVVLEVEGGVDGEGRLVLGDCVKDTSGLKEVPVYRHLAHQRCDNAATQKTRRCIIIVVNA